MPRYIHPHSLVPQEWLYHATIYPPPLSSSMGVIMLCHDISTPTLKFHGTGSNILCNSMSTPLSSCVTRSWSWHIFTPDNIWGGGDYIAKIYSYSQQYLIIISWHYFFTSDNIRRGCDCIVTLCFHSWQYFFWGVQYLGGGGWGCDYICHYIFTTNNIWGGGDYIVTLYFHSRQYLGRGWLYRDIIFSLRQ